MASEPDGVQSPNKLWATAMEMWTIYDHPLDHPEFFVARRFEAGRATTEFMLSPELSTLREAMEERGLYRLERHPQDDPVILETWI